MNEVIALLIYFFPSMVASVRKHNNKNPIFFLNLFTGWILGTGWVASLIWAFTDNVKKDPNEKVYTIDFFKMRNNYNNGKPIMDGLVRDKYNNP